MSYRVFALDIVALLLNQPERHPNGKLASLCFIIDIIGGQMQQCQCGALHIYRNGALYNSRSNNSISQKIEKDIKCPSVEISAKGIQTLSGVLVLSYCAPKLNALRTNCVLYLCSRLFFYVICQMKLDYS